MKNNFYNIPEDWYKEFNTTFNVMNNQMDYREFVDIVNTIDDILKQNNLTLEQLTGVENA